MSVVDLGRLLLWGAWGFAGWMGWAAIRAERTQDWRWRESARGAALAVALVLTAVVLTLEYALVTQNYAVAAVYFHTNATLPMVFRVGALWGGDSGSILFWAWILSLYTAFAAWWDAEHYPRLGNLALGVLSGLLLFFIGVDLWRTNPFRIIPGQPTNGSGLDPLLQNLVMVLHPPAMYVGLIGMSLPFAYVMAALWLRQSGTEWIPLVRRRMLFAWMLLSVALVLGGMWSYMVLGWGGYWEWDPVENAAFLPWIVSTVFLHMIQVDLRRHRVQWWTAGSAIGAYLLTLLGTYITRSGVLKNSVHSFVGSGLGPPFMGFFWVVLVGSLALVWLRRDVLGGGAARDTAREDLLQWFAVLMGILAIVILYGTLYPILSKALWGTAVVYQVGWYNVVTTPLFLVILVLLGLSPFARWQPGLKVGRSWGILTAGAVLGAVFGVVVEHAAGVAPIGAFVASGFALASIAQDIGHTLRVNRGASSSGASVPHLLLSRRRTLGVQVVHLAFVLMALGVIGSHTHPIQTTVQMRPGQTVTVGGYRVTYAGLDRVNSPGRQLVQARLYVTGAGLQQQLITAGDTVFTGSSQPVANVAIESGLMQDLYVVLAAWGQQGVAQVDIMVNPMVSWIWIGMYILMAGTLLMLTRTEPLRATEGDWVWLGDPMAERQ